jgi:3-dehydroquinate dehydratase-1
MILHKRVKAPSRPQLVGVLFSRRDLARASQLHRPPDLFELRLDGLSENVEELRAAIPKLRAPLIITARSPAEGGAHLLSLSRRRELLLRFLPFAHYLDLELRSIGLLAEVRKQADQRGIRLIISRHYVRSTPSRAALQRVADRASSLGADLCKIVTSISRLEEIERLVALLRDYAGRLPLAVMGMGRLGRLSRRRLARAGSVLNYGHLGRAIVPGQLSLSELRELMYP